MRRVIGPLRLCILPRGGSRAGRRCMDDEGGFSLPELAWMAVPKGQRATVSIYNRATRKISYFDVVGGRSAKNITAKLPRLRR